MCIEENIEMTKKRRHITVFLNTQKIQDWLDDHGKTRADFANELGLSRSSVGRYLIGDRHFVELSVVVKMAKVMGVKVDELRSDTNVIVRKRT